MEGRGVSKYLHRRSQEHKAKHLFSGKAHFFEVESPTGEKYTVQIKMGCDCRYMGVQGVAKGKMCSHILAVIKGIASGKLLSDYGVTEADEASQD